MEPSTRKLVDAARDVIHHDVLPHLDAGLQARMGIVTSALDELAARQTDRAAELREAVRRNDVLLTAGAALLDRGGDDATPSAGQLPPDHAPWRDLERHVDRQREHLAILGRAVVDALEEPDASAQWRSEARSWLRSLMREEVAREERTVPPVPRRQVEGEIEFDPEALRHYLDGHLPGTPKLRTLSAERLAGGFSRFTHLVSATDGDGQEHQLVVRQQGRGGLTDEVSLALSNEFVVMDYAFRAGVPSARPLLYAEEPRVMRGAFIVMERAAGAVVGSAVEAEEISEVGLRETAVALATLHSATWRDEEQAVLAALSYERADVETVQAAFERTMRTWHDFATQRDVGVSPVVESVFAWLRRNVPDRPIEPRLVHGDIGFHNMLFDDGHLTALLDWEHAGLGDPAQDLVAMRTRVSSYMDWSTFMGWYVEAGGDPVPDSAIDFYSVWHTLISATVPMTAYENKLEHSDYLQSDYVMLGLQFKRPFLSHLQVSVDEIWA